MGRGVVGALIAVMAFWVMPDAGSLSPAHAAAVHPAIRLARPHCYGHAPQTGSAIVPQTHLVVGRPHGVGNSDLAGFAIYRARASHHWLQVEDGADASMCSGPWSIGGDGAVASYSRYGPQPPRGAYRLAVLYAPALDAIGTEPSHMLYAELSVRAVTLPLQKGKVITLWACTQRLCRSHWFRSHSGR